IAVRTGYHPGDVVTATYTIDPSSAPVPREGLQVWLRADVGITLAGSNKVSQWNDQSGNGNHAVQGSSSRRPVFVSGTLNGKPVVQFESWENHYLQVPDAPGLNSEEISVIALVKRS